MAEQKVCSLNPEQGKSCTFSHLSVLHKQVDVFDQIYTAMCKRRNGRCLQEPLCGVP